MVAHDLIERALCGRFRDIRRRGMTSHRARVANGAPSGARSESRRNPHGSRTGTPSPVRFLRTVGVPTSHHLRCAMDAVHRAYVSNQPLLPGPAEVPRRKQRHSRLAQPGPDIGRALVLGSANVRRARCSQSKNHQSIIKKRISNHRSSIINAWRRTPPIMASRRRAAWPLSRTGS